MAPLVLWCDDERMRERGGANARNEIGERRGQSFEPLFVCRSNTVYFIIRLFIIVLIVRALIGTNRI